MSLAHPVPSVENKPKSAGSGLPIMATLPSIASLQEFTFRRNANGSIDVVCLNCLDIAGTAFRISDLSLIEEAHQCEPSLLVDSINHCWNC